MSALLPRSAQTMPVVAVVYRVPLFLDALVAAFDGFAHVQAVRADDNGVDGFLTALQPDALIVEAREAAVRHDGMPVLHVDLEQNEAHVRLHGDWERVDIDLSPEAIRNAVVATMLRSRR